jgi:phosphohistidine phosphatase
MPRLLLLRHATAERAAPGQSDHQRALTKGGRKEAKSIGRALSRRGERIDLVLSSDSTRTRETWACVAKKCDVEPELRFERSLYEAADYLPAIRAEGGDARSLVVVGHNPAMHATAVALAADLAVPAAARLRLGFPKGALAVLDFDGDWATLKPHTMRLVDFIEPEAG